MKKIVNLLSRLVGKDFLKASPFFVDEPMTDYYVDPKLDKTHFSGHELGPAILPNQVLVINALRDATQTYFVKSVEPLLQFMPEKIWQIKRIQIVETEENKASLEQLKKYSDATLKLMAKSVFTHRIFENLVDSSQFMQLKIVSEHELEEYTGGALAILDHLNIAIQFYYFDEIVDSTIKVPTKEIEIPKITSTYPVPDTFHLIMAENNTIRKIAIMDFPIVVGSSPCADIYVNQMDVSGQHLILQWDPIQQCVFLVDNSKFGTFFNGERKLGDGRRVYLTGQGHFQLTRYINATRFVYWNDFKSEEELVLLVGSALNSNIPSDDVEAELPIFSDSLVLCLED